MAKYSKEAGNVDHQEDVFIGDELVPYDISIRLHSRTMWNIKSDEFWRDACKLVERRARQAARALDKLVRKHMPEGIKKTSAALESAIDRAIPPPVEEEPGPAPPPPEVEEPPLTPAEKAAKLLTTEETCWG